MKSLTTIILLAISLSVIGQTNSTTESKAELFRTVRINDLGISFALPHAWAAIDRDGLAEMNKTIQEGSPKTTVTYVAGFEEHSSSEKSASLGVEIGKEFAPYLFVSKVPGRTSAKELLAQFPSMRLSPQAKKYFDDRGVQVGFGEPYFDEQLKMVIVPVGGGTVQEGKRVGRTYLIPTRRSLVSIGVYCRPESAKRVFAEVERSMVTLQITEAERIPENWGEELKSLLR